MQVTQLVDQVVVPITDVGTELTDMPGLDVAMYYELSFLLENIGAEKMAKLDVYWSDDPEGASWSPADESILLPNGVAAGASVLIDFAPVTHQFVRLVAYAAAGKTTTIQVNATGRG